VKLYFSPSQDNAENYRETHSFRFHPFLAHFILFLLLFLVLPIQLFFFPFDIFPQIVLANITPQGGEETGMGQALDWLRAHEERRIIFP
jgi:hypothetical protein